MDPRTRPGAAAYLSAKKLISGYTSLRLGTHRCGYHADCDLPFHHYRLSVGVQKGERAFVGRFQYSLLYAAAKHRSLLHRYTLSTAPA